MGQFYLRRRSNATAVNVVVRFLILVRYVVAGIRYLRYRRAFYSHASNGTNVRTVFGRLQGRNWGVGVRLCWSFRRVGNRCVLLRVRVGSAFPSDERRGFFTFNVLCCVSVVDTYFRCVFRDSGFTSVFRGCVRASRIYGMVFVFFRLLHFFSQSPRFSFFVRLCVVGVVGSPRFRSCGILRVLGVLCFGLSFLSTYIGRGVFRVRGSIYVYNEVCFCFPTCSIYHDSRAGFWWVFRLLAPVVFVSCIVYVLLLYLLATGTSPCSGSTWARVEDRKVFRDS